jgi:diaminopimelate decarboxylase
VVDNFDEIERLQRIGDRQRVMIRVAPGVRGRTHDFISTGQADSKFGFSIADARIAIGRLGDRVAGIHMHIGSQLLELAPFRAAVEAIAGLGDFEAYNLGGGLGVRYTTEEPPSLEEYAAAKVDAVRDVFGPGRRVLDEPGRALTANSTVTLYSVESIKHNVRTWVAVDGGMSDNLRPMLYGARYEAQVVDRIGGTTPCCLAGKHCESSDVLIDEVALDEPRVGDVIVTPATGAYGYAMANNYNGVPRPPVVFAAGGDARLVVRRETVEDLVARDV